jgi:hypothetical protein
MVRQKLVFPLIFVTLGLVIIACQPVPGVAQASKPTVIISSPPSGSLYSTGEEVVVQSTSTDPSGVTKVALLVDGAQLREDPSPVAQGQPQFSVLQSWIATSEGQHNITVRATNSQGATADSGIIVNVKAQTGVQPTSIVAIATAVPLASFTPTQENVASATPIPQPNAPTPTPVTIVVTATPPSTEQPTAVPPCTFNAKFIADLTIPDGTIFTPGAVFTKSWRVQNTGNCTWDNASLIFVSGTQMAAGGAYPVPTTPPGGTADLTVPMSAPNNYGSYGSIWRIRNSSGQLFGTNLTVVINVPSPATPTFTPVPTAAGCSGKPNDFQFTASSNTITAGQSVQLNWTAVTNASAVTLNGGEFSDDGVTTPGNKTTSPGSTTQYTLTAFCNNSGQSRQHQLTVTVNPAAGNWAGHWEHNFGWMDLSQNGNAVTGTYHNSSTGGNSFVQGNVSGNTLDGSWGNNDGTIHFVLGGSGNTFTGNWDGTEQWCGARSGVSFPSNCAYDGTWTTHYEQPTNTNCAMSLSQVGSNVTGTYCNGTLTGVISYANGQVILTGNWNNTSLSFGGPLIFYLPVYTYKTFSGYYTNNGATDKYDWCGRRGGSAEPSPCLKTSP